MRAKDQQKVVAAAVAAIKDYFGTDRTGDSVAFELAGRRTRDAVDLAVTLGQSSAAKLAAAAGVPQVLVADLLVDDERRREALIAARIDAERRLRDVMERLRVGALDEVASREGTSRSLEHIAQRWGVTRQTLNNWIRDDEKRVTFEW